MAFGYQEIENCAIHKNKRSRLKRRFTVKSLQKIALPKRTLNLLHLETFSLYCVTAVPCSSEIKTSYLAFQIFLDLMLILTSICQSAHAICDSTAFFVSRSIVFLYRSSRLFNEQLLHCTSSAGDFHLQDCTHA